MRLQPTERTNLLRLGMLHQRYDMAETVRTLMIERGITTQAELAALAGLAQCTISRMVNGRMTSECATGKVADALGVTPSHLISGGHEKPPGTEFAKLREGA